MAKGKGNNDSGGNTATKKRSRKAKLMMWLYIIPAVIYLYDKFRVDTGLVMLVEWFDDDPTMWPVADYVEGVQMALLIVGVLVCAGLGIYTSLQEE